MMIKQLKFNRIKLLRYFIDKFIIYNKSNQVFFEI